MSSNKAATKADLQEMYSRILPYLGGSANAGFTPVGTVISVMGVTAPANYLACNGQVVNISDYPELADYFLAQFGSKSKFGGNGTTTFGIPDLRGEFLRGTGTNSHTNQGNGAAVGTHQNGTIIPNMQSPSGGDYFLSGYTSTSAYPVPGEFDYVLRTAAGASNNKIAVKLTKGTDSTQLAIKYTARPTNTSVLYCIATKDIYMNPSLDYSNDERVVGVWTNGKSIFQKTINTVAPSTETTGTYAQSYIPIGATIDTVVSCVGNLDNGAGTFVQLPFINSTNGLFFFVFNNANTSQYKNCLNVRNSNAPWNGATINVTIQYTKA